MKEISYVFKVKCLEAGQRRSYGDSYYSYEVVSDREEREVKEFCMNALRKSYESKDMPNPFAGKLLEFKRVTDNNSGKSFLDKRVEETYSYKLSTEYTG